MWMPTGGEGRVAAPTTLQLLARFAVDLDLTAIPAPVIARTKLILQHNLIVMLAAREQPVPGQDQTEWPAAMPSDAVATRVTDGRLAPIEAAVVTNSLAMGARAQHDEQEKAVSHFGSTTLPPLLAATEISPVDGTRLLTGIVAAYEVGTRIATLTVDETRLRGFRPTGIYGTFAGATSTGLALGLDSDRLVAALAFAANLSSGLTHTWLAGTDEWRYQTAFAGRNGFVAARLAGLGARGGPDTLDGRNGFHQAFAGSDEAAAAVADDLGVSWAVEDVLLKPYPVCAFNQAPVQQLLRVAEERGIAAGDVREVRIRMNADDLRYPGVSSTEPSKSRSQALMSMRTCAAIALLERDVPIASLDSPDQSPVRDLAERVELIADTGLDSHTSSVEVVTTEGTTFDSGGAAPVLYDGRVRAELLDRLLPVASPGRESAQRILDAVEALDQHEGRVDLLAPLRR
jgi:2-methylcitrate dehydratase PrpD